MIRKNNTQEQKLSTRETTRLLEFVQFYISGKVNESPAQFKFTVAFLDDFIKARKETSDSFIVYKLRSENELQDDKRKT